MDITLSDVAWVFGGTALFAVVMTLIAQRRVIAQALRPLVDRYLMSRSARPFPPPAPIDWEHRSYAVEPRAEPSGTAPGNAVPELVERLGGLDEEALLAVLAQLRDDTGEYRYAESRIAKFIPGRVEDRLAQVRAVRGTEKLEPPGRTLRVRDQAGERYIPYR